jgi:transposase-like protein
MLTEEQRIKYLIDRKDRCPYCGSSDLDGGDFRYEESTIMQRINCTDCKKSWQDVYKLADILEY